MGTGGAYTQRQQGIYFILWLGTLALAAMFMLAPSGWSLETIEVVDDFHVRLISHRLDTMWRYPSVEGAYLPRHSSAAVPSGDTLFTSPVVARVINYAPGTSNTSPSTLNTYRLFPQHQIIEEWPVGGVITDVTAMYDSTIGQPIVVAGGFKNDSSFLYITPPFVDESYRVFLSTGVDETGDGAWQGAIYIFEHGDFDDDGHTEIILIVNPGRDTDNRMMMCVDLSSRSIEWQLLTASPIFMTELIEGNDGLRLFAATQSCAHGAEYAGMSDYYSYLLILDVATGAVEYKSIFGRYPNHAAVVPGPTSNTCAILHSFPLGTATDTTVKPANWMYLTVVDEEGTALYTAADSTGFSNVFRPDPAERVPGSLVAINVAGVITALDSTLEPVARSSASKLVWFDNKIDDMFGFPYVYVFRDRAAQTYFVSPSFRVISVAAEIAAVKKLTYRDSDSLVSLLLMQDDNRDSFLIRPVKQTLLDVATVYYTLYQHYVLSFVGLLIGAVIVMQVYRRRDKRSLRLIAEQKAEIERSHTALKEAQEKIIAAEKYRQAKDIAGGFAHEIRNALFPAKSHLHRLKKKPDDRSSIESTERAINRAIDSTRVISTYAHLEDNDARIEVDVRKIIDKTIESLSDSLAELSIDVSIDDHTNDGATIRANPDQLSLIFHNLLRNAIDALTGVKDRRIIVTIREDDQGTEIRIHDTGPGIPEDVRANVFDAFFTTRPQQGTGLGLTIAQKVVEAHEGVISIDADIKQGAGIIVRLPRHAATR